MSIASEITRLQGAKADIKASINAKGGTLTSETFDNYAAAIDLIESGTDTSDATAVAANISAGLTAYTANGKETGTLIDYTADYINSIDGTGDITSLPDTITSIVAYAFYKKNNIKLTSLPSGITTIGAEAFRFCNFITLENGFPSGVTTINDALFADCTRLVLTSIPNGTSLPNNCFARCSSLTTLSVPKASTVGQYCFDGCTALTTVTFGSNGVGGVKVTSIAVNAFYNRTQAITINVYTENGLSSDLTGAPWGATNATINYIDYNA